MSLLMQSVTHPSPTLPLLPLSPFSLSPHSPTLPLIPYRETMWRHS